MRPLSLVASTGWVLMALHLAGLGGALPSPVPVWVPVSFVGEWVPTCGMTPTSEWNPVHQGLPPTNLLCCPIRWVVSGVEPLPRYWVFSAAKTRGPPDGINTCVGAQPFVAEGVWSPGWCTYGALPGTQFCLQGIPDAPLATRDAWFEACFPHMWVANNWVSWCAWGVATLTRLS